MKKEEQEAKKKLKVYLFRHGKTVYNTKGIFTGWKDSKLTKEGIKNAKMLNYSSSG